MFRARCLFSLAALLLLPATALAAQETNDQGEKVEVVFSADQAFTDPATGDLVLRGHVVMIYDGYLLEAGEVRYNEKKDTAIADAGVRITNPDGAVLRATRVELHDSLRAGIIENAHLILENGARLAARRGERQAGGESRLERVVYSPCPACAEDPDGTPLWRIRALKVEHDKKGRRLRYQNVYFDILGVPVAWLPYFSHPDPTNTHASGLLVPEIRTSEELGFVVELPYAWAISPSADLTITPILTTSESPALATLYRQYVRNGRFEIAGSVTHGDQPSGVLTGRKEKGFRGHIFSSGRFLHGANWQSTYQIEFTGDDTYPRVYDFSDADTFVNDYKLEGFFDRSYVRGELLGFQGLRIEDRAGLTAQALPWIDASFVSAPGVFGGTVSARFNSIQIIRTDGADTRRASAVLDWEAPFITPLGQRIVLDATLRGDVYDVRDAGRFDDPRFAVDGGTTVRGFARAAATLSWPFVSTRSGVSQTIEPIVQLVAMPRGGKLRRIPNEDSRTFELNAGNLFALDRAPGYDVWESGSRATYGLRYGLASGELALDVLAGQSYRVRDESDVLADGTGLAEKLSDIVAAVDLDWQDWLGLSYEGQFDKDGLDPRRNEIVARIGPERFRINAGYLRIKRGIEQSGREDREEVRFDARWGVTERWHVFGGLIETLRGRAEPIEWETGVLYRDECCLEFGVTVRKRFTQDRDFRPGTSVIFRIRLRGLG